MGRASTTTASSGTPTSTDSPQKPHEAGQLLRAQVADTRRCINLPGLPNPRVKSSVLTAGVRSYVDVVRPGGGLILLRVLVREPIVAHGRPHGLVGFLSV